MNDSFTWPVGRAEKLQDGAGQHSALLPVVAYLLACIVGGAGTGAALGALGAGREILGPVMPVTTVLLVIVALLAIWLEPHGHVSPLPERKKQVPTGWLGWRPRWRTAVAFGLMLGAGFFTHLRHASVYVLVVVVILSASVEVGAVLGCTYGAARGLVLALTWAGDRFLGRRLRWERIGRARRTVSGALVAASLGTLTLTLLVM